MRALMPCVASELSQHICRSVKRNIAQIPGVRGRHLDCARLRLRNEKGRSAAIGAAFARGTPIATRNYQPMRFDSQIQGFLCTGR